MLNKIKVILADDHHNILENISSLLNDSQAIEVVGATDNGEKALALARSIQPDVLILDIDMPKLNGFQVSRRLLSTETDVKIVILSVYDEPAIVQAAFKQGIRGYVVKNRAVSDLEEAVKSVMEGETFISPPLSKHVDRNPG